eukprot:TRINITY_DN67837_c0_g1_i1.p1 TRINITY_DN67837_c0_g1~~TRINITY_DN67837_c0_g1_i1.p1  ORF type:complete len:487 (+),score=112.51 TRINITY_DN67837_c0_g1_i1:43-1461(+)
MAAALRSLTVPMSRRRVLSEEGRTTRLQKVRELYDQAFQNRWLDAEVGGAHLRALAPLTSRGEVKSHVKLLQGLKPNADMIFATVMVASTAEDWAAVCAWLQSYQFPLPADLLRNILWITQKHFKQYRTHQSRMPSLRKARSFLKGAPPTERNRRLLDALEEVLKKLGQPALVDDSVVSVWQMSSARLLRLPSGELKGKEVRALLATSPTPDALSAVRQWMQFHGIADTPLSNLARIKSCVNFGDRLQAKTALDSLEKMPEATSSHIAVGALRYLAYYMNRGEVAQFLEVEEAYRNHFTASHQSTLLAMLAACGEVHLWGTCSAEEGRSSNSTRKQAGKKKSKKIVVVVGVGASDAQNFSATKLERMVGARLSAAYKDLAEIRPLQRRVLIDFYSAADNRQIVSELIRTKVSEESMKTAVSLSLRHRSPAGSHPASAGVSGAAFEGGSDEDLVLQDGLEDEDDDGDAEAEIL